MKESRKDLIKELHKTTWSHLQKKIEKEFPKLFKKDDLEVGKWYKENCSKRMVCINESIGVINGYGFGSRGWVSDVSMCYGYCEGWTLMTDKEVEQALIKEAKKRGFKKGVIVRWEGFNDADFDGIFRFQLVGKNILDGLGLGYIFNNGKWAEIVKETITKEQAEKELGKIIEG
jgi:hypothetical protein